MTCQEIQDLLSPYLDGEVTSLEKQAVEKHIRLCAACRQELNDLKEVISVMQSLKDVPLPADFHSKLHEKLLQCRQEQGVETVLQQAAGKKNRAGRFLRTPWISVGVAAVIMLAVLTVANPLGLHGLETDFFAGQQVKSQAPVVDGILSEEDVNMAVQGTGKEKVKELEREGKCAEAVSAGEATAKQDVEQDAKQEYFLAQKVDENASNGRKTSNRSLEKKPEILSGSEVPDQGMEMAEVPVKIMGAQSQIEGIEKVFGIAAYNDAAAKREPMVRKTATLEMEVSDLRQAEDQIMSFGIDAGGEVKEVSLNETGFDGRRCKLLMTIPKEKFADVLGEVKSLGSVNLKYYYEQNLSQEWERASIRLEQLTTEEEKISYLLAGDGSNINKKELENELNLLLEEKQAARKTLSSLSQKIDTATITITLEQ